MQAYPKTSFWEVLVNGRRFQLSGTGNRLKPGDRAIGVQRHLKQVLQDLERPRSVVVQMLRYTQWGLVAILRFLC